MSRDDIDMTTVDGWAQDVDADPVKHRRAVVMVLAAGLDDPGFVEMPVAGRQVVAVEVAQVLGLIPTPPVVPAVGPGGPSEYAAGMVLDARDGSGRQMRILGPVDGPGEWAAVVVRHPASPAMVGKRSRVPERTLRSSWVFAGGGVPVEV